LRSSTHSSHSLISRTYNSGPPEADFNISIVLAETSRVGTGNIRLGKLITTLPSHRANCPGHRHWADRLHINLLRADRGGSGRDDRVSRLTSCHPAESDRRAGEEGEGAGDQGRGRDWGRCAVLVNGQDLLVRDLGETLPVVYQACIRGHPEIVYCTYQTQRAT
jgi:hypothetical protein